MCNINALFVRKKIGTITPFLMAVSSHSFVANDNGEGIFTSSNNLVHKQLDKINYFKFSSDIEKSNVVITHQRFSTSGFELEYNHPFENSQFVLVHNGVINQFKETQGSDTFGFWNKFNTEFNSITQHVSREEKITRVLQKLFAKDEGSYSILIFDKKTRQSYYFKGTNYPSIHFYSNDEYLFITTNSENSVFLSLLTDTEFNVLDIKDRKIYKISQDMICSKIADLPEIKTNFAFKTTFVERYSPNVDCCDECFFEINGTSYELAGRSLCSECWSRLNTLNGEIQ